MRLFQAYRRAFPASVPAEHGFVIVVGIAWRTSDLRSYHPRRPSESDVADHAQSPPASTVRLFAVAGLESAQPVRRPLGLPCERLAGAVGRPSGHRVAPRELRSMSYRCQSLVRGRGRLRRASCALTSRCSLLQIWHDPSLHLVASVLYEALTGCATRMGRHRQRIGALGVVCFA